MLLGLGEAVLLIIFEVFATSQNILLTNETEPHE